MKKSIVALLLCSILSNSYAADRPDASEYLMNDNNITFINIQPYGQTNSNLRDPSGRPYTRQFWFTLESSTNLTTWRPVCTITGWANPYYVHTACYNSNGVLVVSERHQLQEGQPLIEKCIAFVIIVGVTIYVGVRVAKYCNSMPVRTFEEGEGPTEPPATNSTSITLPPEVLNAQSYFIRLAVP